MTDENRRRNSRDEWDHYAFHCAQALLLSEEGLEPKTHTGTIRLLHQFFVRTGRLTSQEVDSLALLQSQREQDSAQFTADQAREALALADTFARAVEEIIFPGGSSGHDQENSLLH